jgi:signal transduction histidine kinase
MRRPRPIAACWLRLRTARMRLTLGYGAMFIFAGAALLATTYVLFDRATRNTPLPSGALPSRSGPLASGTGTLPGVLGGSPSKAGAAAVLRQHNADLHQLVVQSTVAFAVMALLALVLGWLMAGRVLRPVRSITAAARDISVTNLHQRLDLHGPDDEFKQLGSTLDDLFARLDASFESQRRFVANAAHELRTPLTEERVLLQVALADPDRTVESLCSTCQTLLRLGVRQERLIEALLTLASSERGIDHWECFELANVTSDALLIHRDQAQSLGINIYDALDPAIVVGDQALVECLVANLIDNALRYNRPGGHVDVVTGTKERQAVLSVVNTGEVIAPTHIDRLLEPFQRLTQDRIDYEDGLGLGLSIVAAVARAHGAVLDVRPGEGGGLAVQLWFPAHLSPSGSADQLAAPDGPVIHPLPPWEQPWLSPSRTAGPSVEGDGDGVRNQGASR